MVFRALFFAAFTLVLVGCHGNPFAKTADISTEVPKGYAPAGAIQKGPTWEDKVQAVMKLGVENQVQAAAPTSAPASAAAPATVKTPQPARPGKIAAVIAMFRPKKVVAHRPRPKRMLSHAARAKSRAGQSRDAKKHWYSKFLHK